MDHPVRERIEKPERELSKARDCIEVMRKSKSMLEFEKNWVDFLHHLERSWNKVENLYRKEPSWNGWVGKYRTLRETDPLLSYLSNARDADEHTIQEIVKRQPGSIGINGPRGAGLRIDEMKIGKGLIKIKSPDKIKITFYPGKIGLLPVVNLGRRYEVPKSHLDKPINPDKVVELAEVAEGFYSGFLKAAKEFISKRGN